MSCFDLASRLEGNGSDDNHMVKSSKCSSNKGPNPKHPLKMANKKTKLSEKNDRTRVWNATGIKFVETHVVVPGMVFVVDDSSSKASSWVDACASDWDGC